MISPYINDTHRQDLDYNIGTLAVRGVETVIPFFVCVFGAFVCLYRCVCVKVCGNMCMYMQVLVCVGACMCRYECL